MILEPVVRQSILIVDDDLVSARKLSILLSDEYETVVAHNGEDALRLALADTPPDLILLDVILPDINGYDICRRLKADARSLKIPIIFITGKDSESDEIKGLEAGAVDYVTKPFRLPIIKSRVRTHLKLKRQQDILENLSMIDGLTGIANRRKFDEYLLIAGEFAARNATPLSLIMIDLDYFKAYNDCYGHYEGDVCLIRVAKTIAESINRKNDLAARYGGEEFVCVLPGAGYQAALAFAEHIRENVAKLKLPHRQSAALDWVTVSLGVATLDNVAGGEIAEKLITAADQALYRAKAQGRNQVAGIE
ncbi:MAG: diguanylate cyclase [Negativicutes bacterium]|jgi:diguanylate cyclase (GGDEF)-like protein